MMFFELLALWLLVGLLVGLIFGQMIRFGTGE